MDTTVKLACDLIRRQSVTPDDAGCQELLAERLRQAGFAVESLQFGEVSNLWAERGSDGPLFVFAGHTDVVPPGPSDQWQTPPFDPMIEHGMLRGRGAADMKSSLAAMIVATEEFVENHPQHPGRIGFLITSDEEGDAVDGTVKVVDLLGSRKTAIDWCLVGEPSSSNALGDVIKNGRRGSLGGTLTIRGIQGHIAYPHLARNPLHLMLPALKVLAEERWDQGNAFFPPTSFQISNLRGGTGAVNVIPGEVEILFNFRFSTEVTAEELMARTGRILDDHRLDYDIDWNLSGQPFLTPGGELVEAARESIETVTGLTTELSTAGGTSDGRFIAPTGAQVLELGPVNATIHKVNEEVSVDDVIRLKNIYREILERLLLSA